MAYKHLLFLFMVSRRARGKKFALYTFGTLCDSKYEKGQILDERISAW